MKYFVATVLLAACLAIQAKNIPSSSVISLLDYYKQHNNEEGRFISGQLATSGQFPYQAAIWMNLPGGKFSFCGGTIISLRWILTAAHCISNAESWDIKLGGIYRYQNEPGQIIIRTSKAIVHWEFNNENLNNDIALLELPQEISFTDKIQPLRLPGRAEDDDRLQNRRARVSGWGWTSDDDTEPSNNLYYVDLDTMTNQECSRYYNPGLIVLTTLCCKGRPEQSTCKGDSGGPLVLPSADGQLTLVGVVSFVDSRGCTIGKPSGFVRTAGFLDWISQKTGIPVRE